jgi:hypothetical protein
MLGRKSSIAKGVLIIAVVLGLMIPVSMVLSSQDVQNVETVRIKIDSDSQLNALKERGAEIIIDYGNGYVLAKVKEGEAAYLEKHNNAERWDRFGMINLYQSGIVLDTNTELPPVQDNLRSNGLSDEFLVQFSGPIAKEWIESIEAMGGTYHQYFELSSLLVKIDPSMVSELKELPYVNWVGPYHPAYKIPDGTMGRQDSGLYFVNAYDNVDATSLAEALDSIGASVFSIASDPPSVLVSADSSLIPDIAALPEVMVIVPEVIRQPMDSVAGEIHKFHYAWYPTWSGLTAPPTAGPTATALTGRVTGVDGVIYNGDDEYEIAGVYDSGFDKSDANAGHIDFFNSPNGDRIVNYYKASWYASQGHHDGDGQECEPHGTACAGIIASDGYAWELSEGLSTTDKEWHESEAGVAPEAKLTLAGAPASNGYNIIGTNAYNPNSFCGGKACWDRMYEDDGARTISNSWGASGSVQPWNNLVDSRIYKWNDLMIMFAAGNDGPAPNTISESGAQSKNGLSIGASQNYRPDRFSSDNHNIIASYSSRGGPMVSGGRIFPNLVAIGTEGAATMGHFGYLCNEFDTTWGQGVPQPDYIMEVDEYDYTAPDGIGHDGINDYRYFGGTSQATPMAAGNYMLIREWLREYERFSYVNSSLAKAFLVNGAVRMSEDLYAYPGWDQGWGRINVKESLFPTPPRTNQYLEGQFNDTTTCNANGTCADPTRAYLTRQINTNVVGSDVPLKATLVWIDPAIGAAIQADLNLKVTSPSGVEYRGNAYNASGEYKGWSAPNPETAGVDNALWTTHWKHPLNVWDNEHTIEQVEVENPEPGIWTVEIIGAQFLASPGNLSLIFSANVGPQVPYKIDLSSEYPPALSIVLGGNASYPFTVSNFGQNPDSVSFQTRPPELPVSFTPSNLGSTLNSLQSRRGLAIIFADPDQVTPGIYTLRITGYSDNDAAVQDFIEVTVEILDMPLPSPIQVTTEATNEIDPSVLVFDNGTGRHIFVAYIKTVPLSGEYGGENVWLAHTLLDSAGMPIEPWDYVEIADLNEYPNDLRFNYIDSGTYAGRVILTWTGYDPSLGDQQRDSGSWGRLKWSDPPYTTWTFATHQIDPPPNEYIDRNSGLRPTNSKRVSFTLFRETTQELIYVYEYLGSVNSETPPTMAGTHYARSMDGGETWQPAQQLFPPFGSPPNLFYFFPTGCVDQDDNIWVFAYYRTGGSNDRDLRVTIYDDFGWTFAPPLIWDTGDNVQFPACMSTAEGAAGNRVYFAVTRDQGTNEFTIWLSWTDGLYSSSNPPEDVQHPLGDGIFSRSFNQPGDPDGRSGPGPLGDFTVSLSDANYNRGPLMVMMNTTDPCGDKVWITYMENSHLESPPYPANPFGTPNIWTLHRCNNNLSNPFTNPDLIRVTADAFAKGHRMADTLHSNGQGVIYETYHSNKGGLDAVDYNVYLTIYTQDWDTKTDLLGPATSFVHAMPNPFNVSVDTEFNLTANLNDVSNGMNNISEAQYTETNLTITNPLEIDWGLSLPMALTGSPIPSPAEVAHAMVKPVAWQPGEVHRFCVRGRDDAPTRNWGRGSCVDVYVTGPVGTPPGAPLLTSVAIEGSSVNITWALSPDDAALQNYEIYVSSIYNDGRLGYQLLGTAPAGTGFYLHGSAAGDTNSYFYVVVANHPSGFRNASAVQGAKLAYHYTTGFHMMSLPLELSTTDLPTLLSGLDYDIAWWYDPADTGDHWKHYDPSNPFNDLFTYNNSRALGVEVISDSYLKFAGLVISGTPIYLEKGWNLIGYPSLAHRTKSEVFDQVVNLERVEGFDPTNPPQNRKLMYDTDTMTPGYGYWVRVGSSQMFTI